MAVALVTRKMAAPRIATPTAGVPPEVHPLFLAELNLVISAESMPGNAAKNHRADDQAEQ